MKRSYQVWILGKEERVKIQVYMIFASKVDASRLIFSHGSHLLNYSLTYQDSIPILAFYNQSFR